MTLPEPQTDVKEIPPSPPKSNRWTRLLLAALLLIGGLSGIAWKLLHPEKPNPAVANAPPPGVKVKLSPVQTGTVEDSTEYIAGLESRRSVNLQPRIQGQVSQIFVKSGDAVSSGTAILQIDSQQQQAAVSSLSAAGRGSQAQLENVRATLKSLQAERLANIADLRLNQQEYKRYSELAAQGAVSRQTQDLYANKLATAKAQLGAIDSRIQAQIATISQVEKSLEQADANIRQQQIQLQYYTITAPFSGTVGDVPVKVGDFVNTSTPLATITQNRPLDVKIQVPLEKGTQLRPGLPVELINPQGKIIGNSSIFFISPNITNNSQSILVKALYNNDNGQLRSDQLIRAKVIWNQRSGVLVPTTAISRIAGETFVFVAETGKSPQGGSQLIAKQKQVKLGNIKGNNYQVIEGLQRDEKLIISGIQNLRDGLPIIPEN
ncbi:efflux RND transporter periplasmic adaptor subunit [Dolichospermum sp. LEGE 00240]|jgi:RND family efflux transporter MFP subunit|uniref:efflux RND transporter periplasmic adaptor subunit n=1 Tax=Dolichospermum sp. LEGE 00240 TaxID=1828603 RepID=UPI001881F53E|nr:efflux RND transporter periplasmic adaptor subunit [Dolichospermum sp. LEGE 00240]MDM3844077.1 efflux RND transporter periplasmic adaptor subunit [Aphanizomenon gracile PMC638.10]MDM3848477.1 efflux RND transporter periplasmic adaptor subunit [Aphanizomenon gracile PMC627.10]MDM3857170.1 efflux RND transporter periplasmic adaptor subunit [Aphanizomenon gracile PMC649.10]MDM3858540.1 efflux RND transporter periplasmic adaptor subunit [Aphanizomenon gracile PMC644.10]MBE9250939.1 efflux RND t